MLLLAATGATPWPLCVTAQLLAAGVADVFLTVRRSWVHGVALEIRADVTVMNAPQRAGDGTAVLTPTLWR